MPISVLVLDDDELVARGLKLALEDEGYHVLVAHDAVQAIQLAGQEPIDLVLCDVRMPGMDGLDALTRLTDMQEGLRSIVITGYASEDAPVRAIKRGVDDYLFKPVPLDDLLRSVRHSLRLCQLEHESQEALESLRQRYLQLVIAVVSAYESQDRQFLEHSRRVATLAVELGSELGVDRGGLEQIELAAWLHDVGLIYIEREVLQKAERLTQEEMQKLRSHPVLAADLLGRVGDLRGIIPILRSLREHYDGGGHPAGLQGEAIPLQARILAVAEAYDSLTHDRPHRPALSRSDALATLTRERGASFDPRVVDACLDLAHATLALLDPEQLLEREREHRTERSRFRALLSLGNLFRDSQEHPAAEQAYELAAPLCERVGQEAVCLLELEKAMLMVRRSRPDEALQIVGRTRARVDSLAEPLLRARLLERMARVLLECGRFHQAGSLAHEALGPLQQAQDRLTASSALAVLALACARSQGQEFPRWYASWQSSLPAGGAEALPPRAQREAAELREEALRRGLAGGTPPSAPSRPVGDTLQVQLFGRLQVQIEDQTVPNSAWRSRKAQELLGYLLIAGRPVPVDRLAEVLWPEEGTREMVHTTAYRVRRALRSGGLLANWVCNQRNFYQLDPEVPFWLDVAEFQRTSDLLRRHPDQPFSEDDLVQAGQALALYRGDFLEGFEEDWIGEVRVGLQERYYRLGDQTARAWLKRGQPQQATQLYLRLLELDFCREELQVALIRCYAENGQRELAMNRYQEYCRHLEKDLGLKPSSELIELVSSLHS